MNIKIVFAVVVPFLICRLHAQSGVDSILAKIVKNNKTLQAQSKYRDAQKLLFSTGLTLYDPVASYDFMRGSPNTVAGNQTDINIVQRFDFPTVYSRKKQLATEQGKQTEFTLIANRQSVLLEAKKICIELVYRNKLQVRIKERKIRTEKFLRDFQEKLDKGEGNILDVNKAKLQLIEITKDYHLNLSAINQLHQQLTELNGGNELRFADTVYPAHDVVLLFEALEYEIELNDPVRKYLEQQTVIAQRQVEVTRALALPKFEAGYHYQGIIGQNFHGGRVGMSIPLWENRNRVKQRQAEVSAAESQLSEHKNEHYYEIRQLYEQYISLRKTEEDYRLVLSGMNNIALLDKALAFGEITSIQYFLEAGYFYTASNNFLLAQKELNEVVAKLYQYKL